MGNGDFERETLSILDAIRSDIASGNIKLENIESDVSKIEGEVAQLRRTIRGTNGDKGLVTEVALLQARLGDHLTDDKHTPDGKPEEKDDKKFITWDWFVNKGIMPVIIAALVWILLEVLPNTIAHLANAGGK